MQYKNGRIKKQRGAIIVFTALALVLMVGMAGLAIDFSHVYVNKTRTQNLADALALSAAISLLNGETEINAKDYAETNTLPAFTGSDGNEELSNYQKIEFTFSDPTATTLPDSLSDWGIATTDTGAKFVRVVIENDINNWLLPVLQILIPGSYNEVAVDSSAVAGPAPIAPCDLAPIMMCSNMAEEDDPTGTADSDLTDNIDKDCKDGRCFGYDVGNLYCLTQAVSNSSGHFCESADVEETALSAGNVSFLDFSKLDGVPGGGAATLADCLGDSSLCAKMCQSSTLDLLPSKTGVNWGPVEKALQDIFNQNSNPNYAPDKIVNTTNNAYLDVSTLKSQITTMPATGLSDSDNDTSNGVYKDLFTTYKSLTDSTCESCGDSDFEPEANKRIFSVPMVDCRNMKGGSATLPVVGYGCLFLTAPAEKEQSEPTILGIFIDNEECVGTGTQTSTIDTGFYKVILYQDRLAGHS